MREILFRGKRKDNGCWICGDICRHDGVTSYIGQHPADGSMVCHDLDPDTVGQFTGLTDKNGKKIFEGDIVKDRFGGSAVIKYGRHDLSCCGCCFDSHDSMGFYLCNEHGWALSDENVWDNLEIIGNIHDNPELLEVAGE